MEKLIYQSNVYTKAGSSTIGSGRLDQKLSIFFYRWDFKRNAWAKQLLKLLNGNKFSVMSKEHWCHHFYFSFRHQIVNWGVSHQIQARFLAKCGEFKMPFKFKNHYFPPIFMIWKENHPLRTLKSDVFYADLTNDNVWLLASVRFCHWNFFITKL